MKNKVKQAIIDFEYYRNGFHHLLGFDVNVKNLTVNKTKAVCDVVFIEYGVGKTIEQDCEYPLDKLNIK